VFPDALAELRNLGDQLIAGERFEIRVHGCPFHYAALILTVSPFDVGLGIGSPALRIA
jgi:hypothetical protein